MGYRVLHRSWIAIGESLTRQLRRLLRKVKYQNKPDCARIIVRVQRTITMHGFTLAIFKPHLLKNPVAYSAAVQFIESCGIRIVTRKQLQLTQSQAEKFYGAHEGKFFYRRLISLMTSGPLEVLILSGENVVTRWRELMGPTKVFKAVYSHPDCVRSLFGLSDTRNATHGSDATFSASWRNILELIIRDKSICIENMFKSAKQMSSSY